jgi:hypothetical protein
MILEACPKRRMKLSTQLPPIHNLQGNMIIYVFMYLCIYVFMYLCIYVFMYLCIYVFMYLCIYAFMYLCIYVFMYLCIYVFMYLCIYVFTTGTRTIRYRPTRSRGACDPAQQPSRGTRPQDLVLEEQVVKGRQTTTKKQGSYVIADKLQAYYKRKRKRIGSNVKNVLFFKRDNKCTYQDIHCLLTCFSNICYNICKGIPYASLRKQQSRVYIQRYKQ